MDPHRDPAHYQNLNQLLLLVTYPTLVVNLFNFPVNRKTNRRKNLHDVGKNNIKC